MVERSGVGYTRLNNEVNNFLRSWIRNVVGQMVTERYPCDDAATAGQLDTLGGLLLDLGELDEAFQLFNRIRVISSLDSISAMNSSSQPFANGPHAPQIMS